MAHCFKMGAAVKWVFCALFDTMSIVRLFHSFDYSKTFSFLRISKNPSTLFLVKVSSVS